MIGGVSFSELHYFVYMCRLRGSQCRVNLILGLSFSLFVYILDLVFG